MQTSTAQAYAYVCYRTLKNSVSTTRGSGWVRSGVVLKHGVMATHPPATAGGTDRIQAQLELAQFANHLDGSQSVLIEIELSYAGIQ